MAVSPIDFLASSGSKPALKVKKTAAAFCVAFVAVVAVVATVVIVVVVIIVVGVGAA